MTDLGPGRRSAEVTNPKGKKLLLESLIERARALNHKYEVEEWNQKQRIFKLEGLLRVILSQDPLAGNDPSKVTIWGRTMDSVRKELAND